MYGENFFDKIADLLKSGDLSQDEKNIIEQLVLKKRNRILHTIIDDSEYIKLFNENDFFPTIFKTKLSYSIFFHNPKLIKFDVLDYKRIQRDTVEEKKKSILNYISDTVYQKLESHGNFDLSNDILQIVFMEWDIGDIGDFFKGSMKSSLVKVFYEYILNYLSSFFVYNFAELKFRITDYIFREGNKKRDLIVKVTEAKEIEFHQLFNSLQVIIPESIVKSLITANKDNICCIYKRYKDFLDSKVEKIGNFEIVEFIDYSEKMFFEFLNIDYIAMSKFKETKSNFIKEVNTLLHELEPGEKKLVSVLLSTLLFSDYSKDKINHLRYLRYIIQPSIHYSLKEFTSCGFMFFSNKLLENKIVDEVRGRLDVYIRSFDSFKLSQKIREEVWYHSIKSAISAIMSRNMSHNIGSHVMSDLIAKMDYNSEEELAHFFKYMQNRMDFIAQITTDFPEWTYPAYLNKELMKIFFENYILLNRIGVSEGLGAYDWSDDDWRKGNMRGKIIVRTCLARLETQSKSEFKWVINEYHMGELSDDLQLAIPGGIVGYHAFYIIIENIIRNSAKHDYAARIDVNNKNGKTKRSVDKIVYIEYESIGKCKFWMITKKYSDQIITGVQKIARRVKSCKALIIKSSCIKVVQQKESQRRDFISDQLKIELIDGSSLVIPEGQKLFILCTAKPQDCNFIDAKNCCDCCLAVDKDYWQDKKPYYQIITKEEFDQLEKQAKISNHDLKIQNELEERFSNIISFLKKGPLRINIRVDDMMDKDYVWVTIWDNMRHYVSVEFDKCHDYNNEVSGDISEDKMKKRVLRLPEGDGGDENGYEIVNLFGYMNDRLRQSFIKETGELKREDWGIAELKICAGFLQNRKIEEIGGEGKKNIQYGKNCFHLDAESNYVIKDDTNINNGYPQMLIKALPVDKSGQIFDEALDCKKINEEAGGMRKNFELKEDDFYYLGFRFWMKKPKVVALVRNEIQKGDNNGK
jgi:hypothetical protein